MDQEKIAALPAHIQKIKFEPWHFYLPKKSKDGKLVIADNFIDEVMRMFKIEFTAEMSPPPMQYGDNGLIVFGSVTVDSPAGPKVTAFASATKMPSETGQTHYAQLVITRALKTAVMRHLYISDHDLELAIEAYGITLSQIKSQTRQISADEPEDDEKPVTEDVPESTVPIGEMGLFGKQTAKTVT